MRLIDANAFLKRIKKDPLFPLVERYGLSSVIEHEPTVEAIPIDWVEEHCDEVADMVVAMWRKENESNISD